VQAANEAPSRLHWKEATPEPLVSVPENMKLAEVMFESAGGLESIELFGAVESSTYAIDVEQLEGVSAPKAAVALKLVVELSATVTDIPAASCAAVPVATGEPAHPDPA
jgi:hypothetical protein